MSFVPCRSVPAILACAVIGPVMFAADNVRFVDRLPGGNNSHYTGNRAPLAPSPLIKLPVGAVRPEGWLRHQLELMAAGFTGHLEEISQFCKYEGNAWVTKGGHGERGWEEVPYWLKGFTDLGLILDDPRLKQEARKWLDPVLANQREDGYFGNQKNLDVRRGEQPAMLTDRPDRVIDLWPNMIMLYPLRSLYEATGDARVLPFMTRYFRWQLELPVNEFLPGSWQKYRGGDNLDSIYWLYNRTGDAFLLELAKRNHERTADWFNNIPTWHGVNISQGFREPAQYFQQARDPKYLRATEANYGKVMDEYGQVPGGMFAADENARPGHTGPRQAAETCSMAEYLLSDEMLTRISGDPIWADRAEDVAFNSLPAAMTPDLKGLHYLTAPNMVQLDRTSKAPMLENGGDMLSYNPYQYRCCQHNVAHAWPYYAENLWMAAAGNGIAAVLYAPSSVKAKVGGGTEVQITETTRYPFDGAVSLHIAAPKPVRFPLVLRVPGWTQSPTVKVNGAALRLPKTSRGWLIVDRTWKNGDHVALDFPMAVSLRKWPTQRNSVSVYRGPLAYSLKIGESWKQYGENKAWPAFEVLPTTPWNYALSIDPSNPGRSFTVRQSGAALAPQPFTPANAPITISVRARRVPSWTLESNGLIGELPASPVSTTAPEEEVTLIPMGCTRLRVSVFPLTN
jgi:DUF1680 family protein